MGSTWTQEASGGLGPGHSPQPRQGLAEDWGTWLPLPPRVLGNWTLPPRKTGLPSLKWSLIL